MDVPLSSIEMRQNVEATSAATVTNDKSDKDNAESEKISFDDLDNVEVSQETGTKKLKVVRKKKAPKSAANAFRLNAGMFSAAAAAAAASFDAEDNDNDNDNDNDDDMSDSDDDDNDDSTANLQKSDSKGSGVGSNQKRGG